jgi:hypothetical protein
LQAKSKSLEKVPVPEVEDVEEIDLEKEVEVFCFWCGVCFFLNLLQFHP